MVNFLLVLVLLPFEPNFLSIFDNWIVMMIMVYIILEPNSSIDPISLFLYTKHSLNPFKLMFNPISCLKKKAQRGEERVPSSNYGWKIERTVLESFKFF